MGVGVGLHSTCVQGTLSPHPSRVSWWGLTRLRKREVPRPLPRASPVKPWEFVVGDMRPGMSPREDSGVHPTPDLSPAPLSS